MNRLETAVRNLLAAVLVAGGLVLGFAHVQGNAAAHGQAGWRSWAIASTVALVALYALLELRKRHADRMPWGWALALLVAGLGLSVGSQLAEAEPSPWGWLYAAWPVLVDLWVVKLVAGRIQPAAVATSSPEAPPVAEPEPEPKPEPKPEPTRGLELALPVRSIREEIEAALAEAGTPVAARELLDARGIKTDPSYVNKIDRRRRESAAV